MCSQNGLACGLAYGRYLIPRRPSGEQIAIHRTQIAHRHGLKDQPVDE